MPVDDGETRLRQWLTEHTGLLLKVVRSFAAGPADSEDLFQEILLQVWMSLPSFREESKPTTWLYKVALNTALTWKRRETKHRPLRQALPLALVTEQRNATSDGASDRETVERMYAAIRELSPASRALVLLYLDGLSYSEMAEVIGISENNVGVRLNRIKKQLAEAVREASHVA